MSRHSPNWCYIESHWKWALLAWGVFKSEDDFDLNARYTCWSCGLRYSGRLKAFRCHIRAKCEGGSCEAWNHHLLCSECHRESEFMNGMLYWRWFHSTDLMERMCLRAIALGISQEKILSLTDPADWPAIEEAFANAPRARDRMPLVG